MRRVIVTIALVLGASAIALPATADQAGPRPRVASRQDAFAPGAQVARNADNDRVRFVAAAPGSSLGRPAGLTAAAGPRAVGRAFLSDHASAFGLGARSTLRVTRVTPESAGVALVRYQQLVDGVPVLAGEFAVRVSDADEVLSVLGEADPAPGVDTAPAVPREDAERTAIAKVAKDHGLPAATLDVDSSELSIYNDALLGGPGPDVARLVWAAVVTDGFAVRERVLVDARTGGVALSLQMNPEAKNRTICDGQNIPSGSQVPCTTPVLTEGGTYGGSVADVNPAYNYSGATYDFFFTKFGRDSLDGAGLPLKSTVRYCDPSESCPFANAFWNGQQMVYGDTYASADDVVGHELSHGVTEFTSNLLYYYQSGAINESMSDVFGELVDQQTVSTHDAPGDRWLMGESLPIGAIRNMANPGAFGDPDAMDSPNYYTGSSDSGGVHTNSGVNNKAAFLMTDGGTFNGQTVTGLGADKVARIYYKVEDEFLTSGSDYADLGLALGAACDALVGTHGFTAADCVEVRDAVQATHMLTEISGAVDMPECPAGQTAGYVLAEGFESSPPWTASDPAKWSLDNTYNTTPGGQFSVYGVDQEGVSDHRLTMNGSVTVPSGGFLSFQHADDFEYEYDGGVVEYSTDGGTTWSDAAMQSVYTGTISATDGNPLAGRNAFTGTSGGYYRTVASLSSLAGQSVKLRFRIGTDDFVGAGGWEVDDVHVGSCSATVQTPLVETGAATSITASGAVLNGTVNPRGTATTARIEMSTTPDFAGATTVGTTQDMGSGNAAVPIQATADSLPPGATRYFRVVAIRGVTTYPDATPSQFTTLATAPAAPVVTGSTPGAASVSVAFTPGADNGSPITGFTAECVSTDGGATGSQTGASSPISVSGLSAGRSYHCRVKATNGVGDGPFSAFGTTVVVPDGPAAPAPPTVTGSTPSAGAVAVAFTPGADNGSPITGYTAECVSTDGGATGSQTGASSPISVSGLSAGKSYHCRVKATNGVGDGPFSAFGGTVLVPATTPPPAPPTPPAASTPAQPVVTGSQALSRKKARISFTTPANGGSPITSYEVSCTGKRARAASASGPASPITVKRLTPGKRYSCRVRALNAVGAGAWSAPGKRFKLPHRVAARVSLRW